jgi:hypothetical protein
MKQKILRYVAILSNILLILFGAYILTSSYGSDRWAILLLILPPILSLLALHHGADCEERTLTKRLKKAHLRKELKSLEEFDKL